MFSVCRSAVRHLFRSPGFTLSAMTILAIGMGVTTAMYSVLYAVILQPLPFRNPDELVALSAKPWASFSIPTMKDWQRRTHAFESIAAYTGWSPRIESTAGTGHANAILVSPNFLDTLGVGLALGSSFSQAGQDSDCLDQAIVSNAYWRRMGGGDSLAGRSLQLDRRTYAVIGVLASTAVFEGTDALDEPSILTRLGCDPGKSTSDRGQSSFRGVGRLKPGTSLQRAAVELETAQQGLRRDFPDYYPVTFSPVLSPLADYMAGAKTRSAILATMAACGMLLLISCANLTNLLLARNNRRRAEFAIRTTLGATPRHLLWQVLAENSMLTVGAAGLSFILSAMLVRVVRQITVIHLPRMAQINLNLPAVLFVAGVAIVVTILLTLLPALRNRRPALLMDLNQGTARGSASGGLQRAGRLLVASQIALALVLVASAGWMVSSVLILLYQPLGFDPTHLMIASTDMRGNTPRDQIKPAMTLAVLNDAIERLRVLPGVMEVAAANDKPLGGRINRYSFCADTRPAACNDPSYKAPDVFQVTPGYFHTVSQTLSRGRFFNTADDGRSHVAIVNHALAAQEWPGEDPVGHRIYSGELHAWATVIGEVGDVHSYSLERDPVPNLYLPEADGPDTNITLMVRTAGDPIDLDEMVRTALRSDEKLTVRYVESMPELMSHQVALRRFSMWIAVAFGVLALGLAILGTYGLLAYEVSLREREIGIRLALGSTRSAIVTLLLKQELRWVTLGLACGLSGAIAVGILLRAEFFHTGTTSIPVLMTSTVLLAILSFFAVAVPGRRASLLDPSAALRRE